MCIYIYISPGGQGHGGPAQQPWSSMGGPGRPNRPACSVWAREAAKTAPQRPRIDKRSLLDAQDGPKTAQEASKTAQEASKKRPKKAPRGQNH